MFSITPTISKFTRLQKLISLLTSRIDKSDGVVTIKAESRGLWGVGGGRSYSGSGDY